MRSITLPKVIYIMGIDGSGKTTIAEYLQGYLNKRGLSTKYLWLRFNHYLTKPLLAYGRLSGLTYYKTFEGVRIGYHDFYKSRWVSWAFIILQYLDNVIARWLILWPNTWSKVVICDRFIYDTLVDLCIETGMPHLYRTRTGQAFSRLIPRETLVIHLDRDETRILADRPESAKDHLFRRRKELYNKIPSYFGIQTIDNNGLLQETVDKILALIDAPSPRDR